VSERINRNLEEQALLKAEEKLMNIESSIDI
jgi:hypothetical protein